MSNFSPLPQNEPWLEVGEIVSPQGLQGELRVKPISDFPERFTKPGIRWLQTKNEPPRKIQLLKGRQLPGKSIYLVRFKGITDRTIAESIVGNKLLVQSKDRPKLAPGEFHLLDLIGLEARLKREEAAIGRVTDLNGRGSDLLEIRLLEGKKKVLIPFVKSIVPEIHLEEGWLLITPPPGLLEL